jgi:hypothetical protein
MPTFTRKYTTVEAIQREGTDLNVTSYLKGDQVAKVGDFLVVDQFAVEELKAQGVTDPRPPKCIYVIPKAEFLRDFDAKDESVVAVAVSGPELKFETLSPVEDK